VGINALLSRRLGEKNFEAANKVAENGIFVTVLSWAVFAVFGAACSGLFMGAFTQNAEILAGGTDYMWIVTVFSLGLFMSVTMERVLQVTGKTVYQMISQMTGAVVNIILDPVFIFVFHMGVQGAAIATVIGQVATFVMAVTYLFRFKTFRIDRSAFRMKVKTCTTVLSLGVSSFITQFAITIVMALTNNLLVSYGALSIYGSEIPMTATGIVMKVNQILISILVGIAVGAQPIIGFNYGAKDFTRVKKALDIALVASEIIAIIAFLIFQFAPMSVVSLFGSEEGLYNEFAVKAFRIFLMLCPLTGFQTVVAVYLQAVGKPLKSAILSLARQIILFVPAAVLLPKFLGVVGVLWTGPVADGLAFLLSVGLLIYERKQLKEIEQAE